MIEAMKASGELIRPESEKSGGRCYACGGSVFAVKVSPMGRDLRWEHHGGKCKGPGDGWVDRMRDLLLRAKMCQPYPGGVVCGLSRVLLAPGPEPPDGIEEHEADSAVDGVPLVWLVDGRHASLAWGRNVPGYACPSFLLGAEWSPFVRTWLSGERTGIVVIHCGSILPSWPTAPYQDAGYFVVEQSIGFNLQRRGVCELSGVPSTGANGRMADLRAVVAVAAAGLTHDLVVSGQRPSGGDVKHHTETVNAPFSLRDAHTLDLPYHRPYPSGGSVPTDHTFAAHQRARGATNGADN